MGRIAGHICEESVQWEPRAAATVAAVWLYGSTAFGHWICTGCQQEKGYTTSTRINESRRRKQEAETQRWVGLEWKCVITCGKSPWPWYCDIFFVLVMIEVYVRA